MMQVGDSLGRYTLVRRLASGGMGDVFLAAKAGPVGFGPIVALKVLKEELARDKSFVDMLIDEANVSMYLNHQNIVAVLDLGQDQGSYYIAMEYVPGTTLERILDTDRGHPLDLPTALFIGLELCRALQYAHTRVDHNGDPLAIVHRDVTPSNILLSTQGEVKLTDFGMARAHGRLHETEAGLIKGKLGYMAPEMARHAPIDARCDLFSAGVVLYCMMTGRHPVEGLSALDGLARLERRQIPRPSTLNPQVSVALEHVLWRCLDPNPDARWPSASALGEALSEVIASDQTWRRDVQAGGRLIIRSVRRAMPEAFEDPIPQDVLDDLFAKRVPSTVPPAGPVPPTSASQASELPLRTPLERDTSTDEKRRLKAAVEEARRELEQESEELPALRFGDASDATDREREVEPPDSSSRPFSRNHTALDESSRRSDGVGGDHLSTELAARAHAQGEAEDLEEEVERRTVETPPIVATPRPGTPALQNLEDSSSSGLSFADSSTDRNKAARSVPEARVESDPVTEAPLSVDEDESSYESSYESGDEDGRTVVDASSASQALTSLGGRRRDDADATLLDLDVKDVRASLSLSAASVQSPAANARRTRRMPDVRDVPDVRAESDDRGEIAEDETGHFEPDFPARTRLLGVETKATPGADTAPPNSGARLRNRDSDEAPHVRPFLRDSASPLPLAGPVRIVVDEHGRPELGGDARRRASSPGPTALADTALPMAAGPSRSPDPSRRGGAVGSPREVHRAGPMEQSSPISAASLRPVPSGGVALVPPLRSVAPAAATNNIYVVVALVAAALAAAAVTFVLVGTPFLWPKLKLESTPPGANVVLDHERAVGKTPVAVRIEPGRSHILVFSLSGYQSEAHEIRDIVERARTYVVRVELKKASWRVNLPRHGTVLINGVFQGAGRSVKVDSTPARGPIILRVEFEDREPYEQTFDSADSIPESVDVPGTAKKTKRADRGSERTE